MAPRLGAVLFETVKLTLRQLDELPVAPETLALRERAVECTADVEAWHASPPTLEERRALINRVLAVHAAVAELGKKKSAPG